MALTIPTGSTHIRVSETTPSSANFIAIQVQGSSTFINGNFRVLYSGHTNFTLAGVTWLYERARSDGAEVITTRGPIDNDVFVHVLAKWSYPGLSYSFGLPRDKMNSLTRMVYFWNASSWQSCDSQCGRGKQVREVSCSRLNPGGLVQVGVADILCTTNKPSLERECNLGECSYSWIESEWNNCNATCDGTGIETRTISCQQKSHLGDVVGVVADHHCDEAPPTYRLCHGTACQYEWEVGPWGSCDATCGQGWRERTMMCVRVTGNDRIESEPHLCSNETTPLSKDSCQSPAGKCSDFQWETTEWSQVRYHGSLDVVHDTFLKYPISLAQIWQLVYTENMIGS